MLFDRLPKRSLLASALVAVTLACAPARADEPSPEALKIAGALIVDIGLKGSVDSIVPGLMAEVERSIGTIHPEMQSALHETVVAITPDFLSRDSSVVADVTHVLASRMTEQELRDSLAFFEGPTGKKYLAVQPVMLQALGLSVGAWRRQVSNDIVTRVREEMKKKGFEF